MPVAGIIAEYNPFHTGHAWHIAQTRRRLDGCAVVCVMSGHWVQRGDCAVFDKWARTRAALTGGADLVIELPTVWAMASAEGFARGAAALLKATGVVDTLSFGSERGDVDALSRLAACLDSDAYAAALRALLGGGLSFARCRQRAAEKLLGEEAALPLSLPNDNLGVEYCRALRALGGDITPMAVPRAGVSHDGGEKNGFASASLLRGWLRDGEESRAAPYMPAPVPPRAASLRYCERAVLARLRVMTADDWAKLPDAGSSEGLPRRLERAGRACSSLEEFYGLAKTKRYAHARLRRLVLRGFLGLTAEEIPTSPPYLRVLGLNDRGQELLRKMKSRASIPMLTKPAHIDRLGQEAKRLFAMEERCSDLYGLCLPTPAPCGRERTASPVIM